MDPRKTERPWALHDSGSKTIAATPRYPIIWNQFQYFMVFMPMEQRNNLKQLVSRISGQHIINWYPFISWSNFKLQFTYPITPWSGSSVLVVKHSPFAAQEQQRETFTFSQAATGVLHHGFLAQRRWSQSWSLPLIIPTTIEDMLICFPGWRVMKPQPCCVCWQGFLSLFSSEHEFDWNFFKQSGDPSSKTSFWNRHPGICTPNTYHTKYL